MRLPRKQLVSLVAIIAALVIAWLQGGDLSGLKSAAEPSFARDAGSAEIDRAFEARTSDVFLSGAGRVVRVLSDDNQGSRHQRFVVELDSGLSVLIAHNIDLAPRINNLAVGDPVQFTGEYEWNDRGGVIHWTHGDPAGRRAGGWIKHAGRVYQ